MDLSPSRRTVVAASLGGAAAIHLAMTPAHAAEWVPLAVAFAVCGWVQGALAVAALTSRRPAVREAAVVVSAASVAVWLLSRTVGLPLGPEAWHPEAVGTVDLLCVGLELLTIAAVVAPVRRSLPRWVGSAGLVGIALATTAVLATPSAAEHAHHDGAAASGHLHDEAAVAADHVHPTSDAAAPTPAAHVHGGVTATTTPGTPAHVHDATASSTPSEATHVHDEGVAAATASGGSTPTAHVHSGATATTTPGTPAHVHDGGAPVPGITSPHHHAACTAPVTAAQRQGADRLATATTAQLARWADLAVAEADGFTPISPAGAMVHYGNRAWMTDGHVLDPTRPESLVYAFPKQGAPILLGAMFLAEDGAPGPQVGGCLTQWHDHTNLCLADRGKGMVGVVDAEGKCPAGSHNQVTAEMLHVWDLPLAGGPFSEATPAELRTAVIAKLTGA